MHRAGQLSPLRADLQLHICTLVQAHLSCLQLQTSNFRSITCCAFAVAACVGTRDDEELKELFDNAESFDLSFFSNNTVAEFVKHFISTGTLHDARVLQMRLKRLLGNATFLQAFQHSGLPLALTFYSSILSTPCVPGV